MQSRFIRSGLIPLVALTSLAMVGATLAQPERGNQPPRRSPEPGRGGDRPRGETGQSVEQCMKMINGAARRLKDQVGDASKKDDNLKLIWSMQKNALQAKTLEPEHLGDGDKAKLLAEFRKDQNELMRMMLKLEDEVAAGKTEDASKTFGSIVQLRDSEHKKFKVKD
jgi:hypothetical protein